MKGQSPGPGISCAKRFWTRRSEPGGAPNEVSVEPAPRVSLSLSAQGRKRGERSGWEFKSNTDPKAPEHPSLGTAASTGGRDPQYFGILGEKAREDPTPTSRAQGKLLQLFRRSDAAGRQHQIRQFFIRKRPRAGCLSPPEQAGLVIQS